jgi:thioredoxin-related protein
MKHIVIILTFLTITSASCNMSRDINFYDLALRDAKRENKLILLDFSAEWCGGCKAYDKYVFQDSAIKNQISKRYILLKINKELPGNKFLIDKYKIGGLPHILLIDSNEKMLGSISGFYSKYVEKPDLFLKDLENIINAQDKIKQFEFIFNSDTTKISSITDLLTIYQNVNRYIDIEKLNNLLIRLDPTPERLFETNYNNAIYILHRDFIAEPLLSFIQENPNMDYGHKWGAYSQLLYFYRDIGDVKNQDIYYSILTKLDPNYFKQHYAEFLFENKMKIDTAITLTKEYNLTEINRESFWGQFLNAHVLANTNKLSQAVQKYSSWMESNSQIWKSGDDYWILYYYAKFANFYNVDLERALNYIQIAEKNRNMPEEKVLLAEILKKLGRGNESLIKLHEALDLVDNQNEYKKIAAKIEEFKK